VSVTHTAKVEKNNTLQGVSIRLEEPLLISSSPEVAYTGRLTVVADNNESLSYTFAECSKEFVVIRHIDENDAVTEKIVMWADSENLLNLIRSPSVLFWNGFNSPSFFANDPMPYNSQQDVEGC